MSEELNLKTNSETASDYKKSPIESIADRAIPVAIKQIETSTAFKRPRLQDIKKNEDQYYGRVKKPLKGRFNIPVPIMPGFVDTLVAKVDERVVIKFGHNEEADYKGAIRVSAMWRVDSSPQKGNWDRTDRGEKKLAALSGVGISRIWSESDPHYRNYYQVVDYNDFHAEPLGGQDLEKHLFKGQNNIIKTEWDIREAAKKEYYSKKQVAKLLHARANKDYKKNTDIVQDRFNRFKAMGLDVESNRYVGQDTFNLAEWDMMFEGERYHVIFDYETGIWLRFVPWIKSFPTKEEEDQLSIWTTWHTHEDPTLFWSKAPADDMRPIADMIRILANQELENRARRNAGMRAYDPSVFKDPSQFKWQPEGLVEGDSSVKELSQGIYEFKTPELVGTINLIEWLDQMAGRKTGITTGAQGEAETDKVGINVMNLQQTADRLGLINKAYSEAQIMKGLKWFRGLREHMPEGFAVKVLGDKGYGWEEIVKDDVNPIRDFDVIISGGNAELEASELKKKNKKEGLMIVLKDPALRATLNPRYAAQETLLTSDWDEEEVKNLQDVNNFGDREILSEAARENQKIMAGVMVKPNVGATSRHVKKHIEFMLDKELSGKALNLMRQHIEAEMPFVIENMARLGQELGRQVSPMVQGGTPPGANLNVDIRKPSQPSVPAI